MNLPYLGTNAHSKSISKAYFKVYVDFGMESCFKGKLRSLLSFSAWAERLNLNSGWFLSIEFCILTILEVEKFDSMEWHYRGKCGTTNSNLVKLGS